MSNPNINSSTLNERYGLVVFLIILIGLVIGGVTYHFNLYFDYNPKKVSLEGWSNVAIYFNNALTPLLMLLSVILLFLTWRTSKFELEKTQLALNSQILLQKKKNDIDIIARQSKDLKDQFEKKHDILDFIDYEFIYSIILTLIDSPSDIVIRYCKDLKEDGFSEVKTKQQAVEFTNRYIIEMTLTKKNLIQIGENIPWRESTGDGGAIKFLKHQMQNEKSFILRDIHEILGAYYFTKIEEMSEIRSFNYLINKICNTDPEYRSDIIEEFKLSFDLKLAKILLQQNNHEYKYLLEI
jgi:hypothetical protein